MGSYAERQMAFERYNQRKRMAFFVAVLWWM